MDAGHFQIPQRASSQTWGSEIHRDLVNTWRLMAERGCFSFDSSPLGGSYHLVSAPSSRVGLLELPMDVAIRRVIVPLLHLRFDELQEISTAMIRTRRA